MESFKLFRGPAFSLAGVSARLRAAFPENRRVQLAQVLSPATGIAFYRWGAALLIGLGVSSGLSGCRARPARSAAPLRPAYGTLEELFQTEVVNIGLEALGYQVVSGSEVEYDIIHEAVANHYLDFTTVHWNPLHNAFYEDNGGKSKLVRAGTLVENAIQGYAIDQATAKKYQISNLEQLKNPKVAAIFDTDGDGKANLVGCPPGWGCRDVIEHHLDAYGLRATVEHDGDNYFARMEEVIAAYREGKPVLYYTWTPLWVSNVLQPGKDVEWLEVPFTALPESSEQSAAEEAKTVVEGKNLGFEINQIEILANRDFLRANPTAARFFEQVRIPSEAISLENQKMRAGENTPRDVRAHAEAWVAANSELFNSWIEAAK